MQKMEEKLKSRKIKKNNNTKLVKNFTVDQSNNNQKSIEIKPKRIIEEENDKEHKKTKGSISKGKNSALKIITLNINGLTGKLFELRELICESGADIILLQETKRTQKAAKVMISGYEYHEEYAKEDRWVNGLMVLFKEELKQTLELTESKEHKIKIRLKIINNKELTIMNIYVPNETEVRGKIVALAMNDLMYKNDAIVIGDWNHHKGEIINLMERQCMDTYTGSNNAKGTRQTINGESDRLIDFAVANRDKLIIHEKCLKDWHISDHYPVEIDIAKVTAQAPDREIFDRLCQTQLT